MPLGSSPAFSILAIVPTVAKPPSTRGTSTMPAAGLLGRGAGPLRLVGLERDRDDHLREHDALRERQQGQQLGARVAVVVERSTGRYGTAEVSVSVMCLVPW